jgi:prepilin-type N-terminal cleavage/methylation domain-containing protein
MDKQIRKERNMKKKGFTLIELLVVIAIIAMLLAILMPALNKVKKIAQRVICGTNLKGLGTAQTVYANDYDDEYAVQGRTPTTGGHTWNSFTDGWQATNPVIDFSTARNISVGASLYLLVREADVAPKSFVCASSDQTEFSGKNSANADIVELWDFGHPTMMANEGPVKCVSYSYQMPYASGQSPTPPGTGAKGKFAPDSRRSAAFAMMADKSPWFESKLTRGLTSTTFMDKVGRINAGGLPTGNDFSKLERWAILGANAYPHGREGQNVTYADGHNSWETRTDVGVKNDNIYTRWTSATTDTTGLYNRIGSTPSSGVVAPTDLAPWGIDDSVLVNDGITNTN